MKYRALFLRNASAGVAADGFEPPMGEDSTARMRSPFPLSERICDASHFPRPCGCTVSHEWAAAGGVMDCGTAGNRTPRRGEKITKRPLEPFVPCPRALSQRGAGITYLSYYHNEQSWRRAVESNHPGGNESKSKETADTTGARHSRVASSRRDAGFINQNMKNTFMVCGARRLSYQTNAYL